MEKDVDYTIHSITIDDEDKITRLDQFLTLKLQETKLSRSKIQKLIKSDCILVDGVILKPSTKLQRGQKIQVNIPHTILHERKEEEDIDSVDSLLKFKVLHEDEDILVINKPKGMKVFNKPSENSPINSIFGHSVIYQASKLDEGDADDVVPGINI